MEPKSFIERFANDVQDACRNTSIFASVCLAQAGLETGWGKAIKGNNMFGIKAKGKSNMYWKGDSFLSKTTEYINGKKVIMQCAFRKYDSIADSIRDRNLLFLQNKRYAKVLTSKTPEEQVKAIKEAGYATGLKYTETIISIINKYSLKQYD